MNWVITPLDGSFERTQFDCGDDALNRFIRQHARQQQDKPGRVGTPFVPTRLLTGRFPREE